MFNNQDFKNNPKPLFENDFNFSNPFDQTMSQNSIGTFEDTPPQLGPISNLSGIQQIEGPTGDALSPMNIMPETFEKKHDPLSAYDNGNINLNGSSNIFGNNDMNVPSSFENNLSYNPGSDLYNPLSFDIPTNNNNFDNVLIPKDVKINDHNLTGETNEKSEKEVDNKNEDFLIKSPIFNLNEESYTIDNSSINEENKLPDIKIDKGSLLSDISTSSILNFEEKQEEATDTNDNYEIVQDKTLEEKADIDYEIVQDKEINEEKDSNNLIDLGIDDIYAEEDTIDIVDFDEDEQLDEEEKEISIEETAKESQPIMNNVKKIKEYILKLKEEGLNVEIEEFDFEHMYQLIVKIDK